MGHFCLRKTSQQIFFQHILTLLAIAILLLWPETKESGALDTLLLMKGFCVNACFTVIVLYMINQGDRQ